MARQRSPNIDKALKIYEEHQGNITNREIANILGEDEKKIAVWKKRYDWDNNESNVVQQKNKRCTTNKNNITKANKEKKNSKVNSDCKTNTHNSKARYGNKNALGNKGGPGGPFRNKKAETHGFFSKYLPEETLGIIQDIEQKHPLDIVWENITIQYAAIIRSQKIMYVKDKEDLTRELKRQKQASGVTADSWEKEYELQFAWDKQATFLQAQSRAMSELRSLIKQYDEMLHANWDLATEEQKLRINKLKVDIEKTTGDGDKDNDLAKAVLQAMKKRNGGSNE